MPVFDGLYDNGGENPRRYAENENDYGICRDFSARFLLGLGW